MKNSDWFEVIASRPHLYTIRERLDLVDDRFYTKHTNLYLILGEEMAILFDTGIGIANLKLLVNEIIEDRDLMIINSHNHFDHVGANHQFDETHIHRLDFKRLVDTMDLDFLRGCDHKFKNHFEDMNWKMSFADDMVPLIGNEIINLGNLEVEIIYTPGHTPGSICLITSKGELLTGDTIHYGSVYLPSSDKIPFLNASLKALYEKVRQVEDLKIFPGHEKYDIDISIFDQYFQAYDVIRSSDWKIDRYLQAKLYEMSNFTFIEPLDPTDPDQLTQ